MTVVFGPNEAGKSSLHAALYAGLCGIRRGKGQPRKEDQEFEDFHRPWDGTGHWEVGAVVTLGDGRRIELRHDLDGKVACRATDELGRDVSAGIMHDGAPDGSKWLGLDRRSFRSTACVRQADVLAILDDASQLQEELQRAAASAGKDETAARALALIDEFRREHVGRDQANSTKPLRRAREKLARAQTGLETANKEHEGLIDLATRADLAAAAEREAHLRVQLLEVAFARREASLLATKVERVRELSARFAAGAPPELPEDDELADAVARALQSWAERPSIPVFSGPTSEEFKAALDRLPALPEGDLEADPSVLDAFNSYQRAAQALELHQVSKPEEARSSRISVASEEELRVLARDVATVEPSLDAELEGKVAQLRQELDRSTRSRGRRRLLVVVAAIIAVAGVFGLVRGDTALGAGLLIVGLGGWIVLLATGGDVLRARQLEQLLALENTLGETRHAIAAAQETRGSAIKRAESLGLPFDPEALRQLAAGVAASERSMAEMSVWTDRRGALETSLRQSEAALRAALTARDEHPAEDLRQAMARYGAACARRAALSRNAAERPALESRLADRLMVEKAALDAARLRDTAERRLHEVAERCGLPESLCDTLVNELEQWRLSRQRQRRKLEADRSDWSTLEALVAGRTTQEIEREALEALHHAEEVGRGLDTSQVESILLDGNVQDRMAVLRAQLSESTRAAGELQGKLEEQQRRGRSVSEAEETLALAETEAARVQRLDEALLQTQEFLEKAQERVHRSIAPGLRETLNKFLSRATNGRYTESAVDPETLGVKIRAAGGNWRAANLLSQGTAEQVYLLLRIALVEHLTRPSGEVCPLIFDDVMVQSDELRKKALLKLLHEVSAGRQVILFTMEPSVADWARSNLREPDDLLISLDGSDIAA